jgi:plastocyanin
VLPALVATLPASLHAEASAPQPKQAAVETLIGAVRQNATIDLRHSDGTPVTQLQGGAYSIEVHDESASHNFHLTGPGVDQSTEVSWSGTVTWSVNLAAGSYRFQCDPHNDFMNGSFAVGSAPPPAPPPPPPPSGERVLTGFVGPGYDIGLRDASGNEVNGHEIPAGTYRIEIYDYSSIHNFELKGDNFDKETDVSWTGHVTWRATFNPGEEYEYECDPHHHVLYGEFRIGASAPPLPPPPPPPPAPPATPGLLIATVRSNFTIDVRTPAGQKVDTVKPGPYTIEVRDQSNEHNFHLQGPNASKSSTVGFVGTQKWAVTLSPGTYRYQCDPHATVMKGVLTVTQAAAKKTKVSAFRVRRSGRRAIVTVKVDQAVSARIQLLRRSRVVSGISGKLRRGANVKRLRVKRPGRYLVRLVLIEQGSKRTYARPVRL